MAVLRTARIAAGKMEAPPLGQKHVRASSGGPVPQPNIDAPVYTCPAGIRTVIRGIDFWAEGDSQWPLIGPESSYAWIEGPGYEYAIVFAADTITRGWYAHWTGQAVMEPGEVLVVGTIQVSLSYQVSGAKMPIPA